MRPLLPSLAASPITLPTEAVSSELNRNYAAQFRVADRHSFDPYPDPAF
jgi:hypothetical protein